MAFVDDFTAWVTGSTAQDNRKGVEAIIEGALDWEKRSGATFEAEKTAIIHFTRNAKRADSEPFSIKGQEVQPKEHVKILGVVMDMRLKYKQHVARAASKGLEAAMELKRLRGLSPATARQLFTAMVVPTVDFASNVWGHAFKDKLIGPINRIQRAGAQAIVGTYLTVATAVAEAEAHIPSVQERLDKRVTKLWIDVHTLPETNPLRRVTSRMRKLYPSFRSPLYQTAHRLREIAVEEMETIEPFTLAPWKDRVRTVVDDKTDQEVNTRRKIRIAVSSSARHGVVGVGGAIELPAAVQGGPSLETFSFTLGMRTEQSPYSGELAAMAYVLRRLPEMQYYDVTLMTSSKAAALTLGKPGLQSGQEYVRCIYDSVDELQRDSNTTTVVWTPLSDENELLLAAKREARKATKEGAVPEKQFPKMRSTTFNIQKSKLKADRRLPEKVGKYSKRIDTALPGKHTRDLYDNAKSWREANALAQLRTDMSCLNESLYRIRAVPSGQCECGQARETVEHYLFRCRKWTPYRTEMLQCTDTRRGNVSFFLGGKAPSDGEKWKPNMEAVRATIRFALATGRLDNS